MSVELLRAALEHLVEVVNEIDLVADEVRAREQQVARLVPRDLELALKKLSARTAELPLALEQAKMAEEIRAELESEPLNELALPATKEKSPPENS